MKHLKRYNESYKEPLDVELDVDNFRKMFKSIIGKYTWEIGLGKKYSLDEHLNEIVNNNPTLTDDWEIWGVYRRSDPSDRHSRKLEYTGYCKAVSEDHAKLKMSIHKKEINYFINYEAEILYKDDIEGIIDSHEHEIYLIKNPI